MVCYITAQYQYTGYNLRRLETGGRGSTVWLASHGSEVTFSSNACKHPFHYYTTCPFCLTDTITYRWL